MGVTGGIGPDVTEQHRGGGSELVPEAMWRGCKDGYAIRREDERHVEGRRIGEVRRRRGGGRRSRRLGGARRHVQRRRLGRTREEWGRAAHREARGVVRWGRRQGWGADRCRRVAAGGGHPNRSAAGGGGGSPGGPIGPAACRGLGTLAMFGCVGQGGEEGRRHRKACMLTAVVLSVGSLCEKSRLHDDPVVKLAVGQLLARG